MIVTNLMVGLFQTLNAQSALGEPNRQNFGVAESRLIVIRVAPLRLFRMLLDMVVSKHVDFGQSVIYAWHWVVLH
jgi:hypothetical protein